MKNRFVLLSLLVFFCISDSCKKKSDDTPAANPKIIAGSFTNNNGRNNFCVTPDHGFVFTHLLRNGSSCVAKYNADFSFAWESILPGYDNAGGICTTSGNGLAVVFNIPSEVLASSIDIEKLNSDGIPQWRKKYYALGMHNQDYTIRETPDKGFIILTTGVEKQKLLITGLIKLDSAGDSLWYAKLPGSSGYASDMKVTSDGGLIITATDMVLKTDSLGNRQWQNSFPDFQNPETQELPDGSFIVIGDKYLNGITSNMMDILMMKFDDSGNKLWEHLYDFEFFDYAGNLCLAPDGGIVFTVLSNGKVRAVKTDSGGNQVSVLEMPGIQPLGIVWSQGRYVYFGALGITDDTLQYNLVLYSFTI
ncbi:MAG: hypothetical protein NTX61_02310 [Bacteroidetes bacterium]|nr:hypothetical protein [Bacteroidota bacterium]